MVFGNSPIVSVRVGAPHSAPNAWSLSRSKGKQGQPPPQSLNSLARGKVGMREGLGTLFTPYIVLNGVQKRLAMVFGNSPTPR